MPDGSRQPTRNLPCVTRQYLDVCPTPDMCIFLPKCHSIDLYQTFSEIFLIPILHEDFMKVEDQESPQKNNSVLQHQFKYHI